MFKNNERRFQYNINPQGPEEIERFQNKYALNNRTPDYTASTATPINKRGSINYSMHDDRQKSNAPVQQSFYQGMIERNEPRGRVNSETHMKRSTERTSNAPRLKHQYGEQSFKQTKKVYFGDEQGGYKDYNTSNQRNDKNRIQNRGDENRRCNGEEYNSFALQENSNYGNGKPEKDFKSRKNEPKQEQNSDYGVNEKEIMEKIGRINRLNQQINNRLQRMLNKIDGA